MSWTKASGIAFLISVIIGVILRMIFNEGTGEVIADVTVVLFLILIPILKFWKREHLENYLKEKIEKIDNQIQEDNANIKTLMKNRITDKVKHSYSLQPNNDNLKFIHKKFKKIIKMQDEEGYVVFWKKSPVKLIFRTEDDDKRREYTLYQIAIEPNSDAHVYWFCKDSDGDMVKIDRYDVESLVYYKNKRAEEFELGTLIGYSDDELENLRYECREYFTEIERENYLQKREQEEKRNETLKALFIFEPVELRFSIYGDYFDKSKPANNMKYTLFCSGLWGYPDNKEIVAFIGNDEQGNEVKIKLNAIRTMIGYEGKKYHLEDFLEIAKTW